MDFIERAWANRALYTIMEEDEEIQHSSTQASTTATDHLEQPSAVSWVESSDGEDNSLGSMSRELSTALAGIERRPNSRLNRRESALHDRPRLLRNPSQGRATDGLMGIMDRNGILDSSGGMASEADIRSYRQWCLERWASSRQEANPLILSAASAERDDGREPTTPVRQTASSRSVEPVRHQDAQALRCVLLDRRGSTGSTGELLGQAGRPDSEGGPHRISDAMSDQQKTREATLAIAGAVVACDGNLDGFSDPELADFVYRFSRWPDQQKTREATLAIAGVVVARAGNLGGFSDQELADLVNGFGKWPEQEKARKAIVAIAGELGSKGRRFRTFSTPALVRIANGLSRGIEEGESAGEVADPALLKDQLHQLAHHLQYAEDRLQQADVHAIASIFKALGTAQLLDDLGALARPGLDRLEELRAAPGFKLDNNLETMGNLCASLLPLARSPKAVLRWYRRSALNLLNAIQPVVEHKIDAHLKAGQAERTSGANASRFPALSIHQVLKARAVLETLYRRPYLEGDELALQARQQELHGKTRQILDSARALIDADLSHKSWNVIAEIEAQEPLEALDTFMAQNASMVQAQHAAASFDVHRVLQAMDHEPRPPQGDAGLMRLPVVDMQGRPLASEAELRYSIFHRLTSGAVKVVAVQLKGTPTGAMLQRTFTVKGVPYRMDLFGGSKLKPPQESLNKLASQLPFAAAEAPSGKLLAIPYAETAPGTAFEQLSRAWAPFKEAYYYTQRRGFAAPPGIPDVGPHDYALEGCFKLSLLPDRPAGAAHPFRFEGRDGEIALRPHDGCGFIRASLAERMPAIARARHDAPERMPAYADKRQSAVPPSALQHYPRSVEVAQETREKALAWLETHQSLTVEELFRTVTGGHIEGSGAIAVPSSDECLHVPTGKGKTLTRDAGVLVGRSPYDKPNLRPFAADRVRSARDGDRTAAFLDRCVAFQYSFNVAHRSGAGLAADDPTFFAKGILIVVPDEMWPADFAERGVVMSAEDVKCHSRWLEAKDRVKADTALECVGILQATEVFAPGSLVAVPSAEQKKLDGDFDGDAVVIIGDRPRLYEHVRQFDAQLQARGIASMKPPKSHTPAIEKGGYQFSRSKQILSATGLVLETYSCLQRNMLAQPLEAQRWFAERAIFGTYEGIHPELNADIRALLQEDRPDGQTLHELIARAGEDSKAARHPVACELAALLVAELQDWNLQLNSEPAHEQSELARSVASTGAKPAVSADAGALFPKLSESYPATADARKRIDFLLNHYQPRIDPRPDGYNPDDLHESAINLLSVGIKVGTDAYKSDTGARVFMQKTTGLQRLLERWPGFKPAPYVKAQAAKLHQGRFDVDGSLADLKDNPTLAASVMEASIRLAVEKSILPSALAISADDDPASRITLSSEQALERARLDAAHAEAQESAITETVRAVAELLRQDGIEVKVPHLDQRSRGQVWIADELTGQSVSAAPEAQLVTNAVRHVFEIPDETFRPTFKNAVRAFEERDCSHVETTNWFTRMDTRRLRGVHAAFRTAQNYRFEVEFHTPASYWAKLAQSECKPVPVPDGAWDILQWSSPRESRSRAAGTSRSLTVARQQIAVARSPQAGEILAALGTRPVVLVGMPASGKATIGAQLAKELGVEFVDIDKRIVAEHGNLLEMFADPGRGEAHFRDLETKELAKQLERGPIVIATGAGCFGKESNQALVLNKARSIWLDTELKELRRRLKRDTNRPLLQGADIEQKVDQLYEEHSPFYQKADIRLPLVPPFQKDKKDARICVKELYAFLCSDREAALPAAEISHVSGASGTANRGSGEVASRSRKYNVPKEDEVLIDRAAEAAVRDGRLPSNVSIYSTSLRRLSEALNDKGLQIANLGEASLMQHVQELFPGTANHNLLTGLRMMGDYRRRMAEGASGAGGSRHAEGHTVPSPAQSKADAGPAQSSDPYAGLGSLVDLPFTPYAEVAPAQSSDTYAGLESFFDLPYMPHALQDGAHHAPIHPPMAFGAQDGALDPVASTSSYAPGGLQLDTDDWLGDDHIHRDYELLEEELRQNAPNLADRTRLADPLIVNYSLRLGWNMEVAFQRIVNDRRTGNDTADFLFLPVSDASATDPASRGSHWSLLFVDRRDRSNPVAYHYDSLEGYHREAAATIARNLGAYLVSPEMAQQRNGYDCGVYVVDGTRELVGRLAQGQWPAVVDLNNLVADRERLQRRLSNPRRIRRADDAAGRPGPSTRDANSPAPSVNQPSLPPPENPGSLENFATSIFGSTYAPARVPVHSSQTGSTATSAHRKTSG